MERIEIKQRVFEREKRTALRSTFYKLCVLRLMGTQLRAPAEEVCRTAVSERAAGNVHDILPPTGK